MGFIIIIIIIIIIIMLMKNDSGCWLCCKGVLSQSTGQLLHYTTLLYLVSPLCHHVQEIWYLLLLLLMLLHSQGFLCQQIKRKIIKQRKKEGKERHRKVDRERERELRDWDWDWDFPAEDFSSFVVAKKLSNVFSFFFLLITWSACAAQHLLALGYYYYY